MGSSTAAARQQHGTLRALSLLLHFCRFPFF